MPGYHCGMRKPEVSVVIVSDYSSTATRTWNDERKCLDAVAQQDFDGEVEIILCEDAALRPTFPDDLFAKHLNARVLFTEATDSYALKNAGVRAASAPIVALLDADCRPSANWLRLTVACFQANARVAVVNGRTYYDGTSIGERTLCLLTRAYIDPGHAGETVFAGNNATGFRRETYLAHPLPEHLGPFAARVQSESIRRAGGVLWFEPAIRVAHEFEGWSMEADIRRNIGYATIATRLSDSRLPYASLVRLGKLATPVIAAGKLLNAWRDCIRCARFYRIRPHEITYVFGAAIVVQAMELRGMLAAYNGHAIGATSYR